MMKRFAFLLFALGSLGASAQTAPTTGVMINPGSYDGSFGDGGNRWGTRLTVDRIDPKGAVVGEVILYAGVCDGIARPFKGTFDGKRLVGKTNGPEECLTAGRTDVAVDAMLDNGTLRGVFNANKEYAVSISGVKITTVVPETTASVGLQ